LLETQLLTPSGLASIPLQPWPQKAGDMHLQGLAAMFLKKCGGFVRDGLMIRPNMKDFATPSSDRVVAVISPRRK